MTLGSYFTFGQDDIFFMEYTTYFYLSIGLVFSLVTTKLIISTMAKVTFPPFNPFSNTTIPFSSRPSSYISTAPSSIPTFLSHPLNPSSSSSY